MKIAVIGAGLAGRQFAADCAVAGFDVCLEDVMPSKLRNAQASFASLGAPVRFASTVEEAVENADLAIDFVPDELESKLEIYSMMDRMAPPRTILCTPSETLSITDLASCTYRPECCVMLRGLSLPGTTLKLLRARATSSTTLETTRQLLTSLRREYEEIADPDLPMLMKNMGDTALDRVTT